MKRTCVAGLLPHRLTTTKQRQHFDSTERRIACAEALRSFSALRESGSRRLGWLHISILHSRSPWSRLSPVAAETSWPKGLLAAPLSAFHCWLTSLNIAEALPAQCARPACSPSAAIALAAAPLSCPRLVTATAQRRLACRYELCTATCCFGHSARKLFLLPTPPTAIAVQGPPRLPPPPPPPQLPPPPPRPPLSALLPAPSPLHLLCRSLPRRRPGRPTVARALWPLFVVARTVRA